MMDGRKEKEPEIEVLGGVAIIPVYGDMVMRASYIEQVLFGLTSYAGIERDFNFAMNSRDVHSILFRFGTLGGVVSGVSNLSELIRLGREEKKINAYVDSYAASAGYYIASATSKIFASKMSLVGGIGTLISGMPDDSRIVTVVSDNAPNKKIDISTEKGVNLLKNRVNYMEKVFIDDIATNRGVSRAVVLENYGNGDMLIGEDAVLAGLVDEVSTYNDVLAMMQEEANRELNAEDKTYSRGGEMAEIKPEEAEMNKGNPDVVLTSAIVMENHPEVAAEIIANSNKRISDILSCSEASGREALAKELAFNTTLDKDAAVKIMASSAKTSTFDEEMSADTKYEVGANADLAAAPHSTDKEEAEVGSFEHAEALAKSQGLA